MTPVPKERYCPGGCPSPWNLIMKLPREKQNSLQGEYVISFFFFLRYLVMSLQLFKKKNIIIIMRIYLHNLWEFFFLNKLWIKNFSQPSIKRKGILKSNKFPLKRYEKPNYAIKFQSFFSYLGAIMKIFINFFHSPLDVKMIKI